MNIFKIVGSAFKNTFRSKLRTALTATAIFIGAFTLMLTNGIGTGINAYIDTQLDSIGGANVMDVRKGNLEDIKAAAGSGVKEYDPEKVAGPMGMPFEAMNGDDIKAIKSVPGVESVRAVYFANPDYISAGGKKYELTVNVSLPGGDLDFMAGGGITDDTKNQIVLQEDYVEALGFDSADAAIGETIEIGATGVSGDKKTIDATVVGVQKPTLINLGVNTSENLRSEIHEANNVGLPAGVEETFLSAQITYDTTLGEEHVQALKDALDKKGFYGATVTDQIGMFKTIIDVIVTVLNGFAVIALIAAGFGIINTLLMSVQERTREIGLMKAMGLSSGRVFSLFTFEALFIGLLGSVMGLLAGWGVGFAINNIARGSLEALGGIDVIVFTAPNVLSIVAIILVIAFIAGTLPAARAARQNPIDALRYE